MVSENPDDPVAVCLRMNEGLRLALVAAARRDTRTMNTQILHILARRSVCHRPAKKLPDGKPGRDEMT